MNILKKIILVTIFVSVLSVQEAIKSCKGKPAENEKNGSDDATLIEQKTLQQTSPKAEAVDEKTNDYNEKLRLKLEAISSSLVVKVDDFFKHAKLQDSLSVRLQDELKSIIISHFPK